MSEHSEAYDEIRAEHVACVYCYGRERADEVLYKAFAAERVELNELREAIKGYRMVLRPWLDGAIGRTGTVTYAEWSEAVERLESAISKGRAR